MASGENKIKADFRLEKGLVWVLFFTTYSRHMVELQAIGISQLYSALGGGGGGVRGDCHDCNFENFLDIQVRPAKCDNFY